MTPNQEADVTLLAALRTRADAASSDMQLALQRGGDVRLRDRGITFPHQQVGSDLSYAIAVGEWGRARAELKALNAAINAMGPVH